MSKYVFITGGTKGIGKAVAECLAKSGYHLILTYSADQKTAVNTQQELQAKYGISVSVIQADNSNLHLYLDALVMNAGTTCRDSFEQMQYEDWERVFCTNVHFPVFLLQRIITRIKKGGSVVFTGSLMGIEPHSVSLAYGVTKSAVHSLVKNLVKFLVPYEVRVNGVAPGFVDTGWQKNKPAEIRRNIERKVALGRFCDPMEVAEVYKMLIENSYFNGEVVVVDGGYSYK